jgi:hypothetical protein
METRQSRFIEVTFHRTITNRIAIFNNNIDYIFFDRFIDLLSHMHPANLVGRGCWTSRR